MAKNIQVNMNGCISKAPLAGEAFIYRSKLYVRLLNSVNGFNAFGMSDGDVYKFDYTNWNTVEEIIIPNNVVVSVTT